MDYLPNIFKCKVSIIGLGYVGLPLCIELSKNYKCLKTKKNLSRKIIGYDLDESRIKELNVGHDRTNELSTNELINKKDIEFTSDFKKLKESEVFIVTVPTPIDETKRPDLKCLGSACRTIGKVLKERSSTQLDSSKFKNPIIIFESTVYPGATEEYCIPIIEEESELKFNDKELGKGFFCGYSPERVNPGDKKHKITNIVKVTSGSNPDVSYWVDGFYASIIKAGTFAAKSIKVAEAAKVIENTQRDLNIALMNEFSIIFKNLGINTKDVLDAASTKWNFLPFKPGLVGGHCIGVDPYYLTFRSEMEGYQPQIVLAGRRINDGMSLWVADQFIFELIKRKLYTQKTEILVMGISFKENCPDIRNTKVIDLINHLKKFDLNVSVFDPHVDKGEVLRKFNINILGKIPKNKNFKGVIMAVAHEQFKEIKNEEWENLLEKEGIFFDLKNIIPKFLNPITI